MRKSFTRLLGLLMLVCMMSFNVVAQTLSPADGFGNVDWRLSAKNSTGVTFTLTFAQDVFPGRTGAGVIALSNDSYVQMDPIQITGTTSTNPVTGSTVVISGKKVTITFKNDDPNGAAYKLTEGKKYYITASPDAIEYANGTYWAGLRAYPTVDDYDFTAGDFTKPVLAKKGSGALNLHPEDNASAFSLTGATVGGTGILSATFTENIAAASTGLVAIYKADGSVVDMFDLSIAGMVSGTATPTPGKLGIVGSTLYIRPSADLKELTNYYVRISAGAITDNTAYKEKETDPVANKYNRNIYDGINNNTVWNFTSADVTAPTVAFNPENAKERIANNSTLVITFTDNRLKTAGEGINDADLAFDLYKGATKMVDHDVTLDVVLTVDITGKKKTDAGYTPVPLTANTDYTAKVTAKNVITITLKAAYNGNTGKFISGATYEYGVNANTFNDVENNKKTPLTTAWFKADDTTVPSVVLPTASNEFLLPGGIASGLAAPFNANNTAADLETTKIYFAVNATDVDAISGIESKPTTIKYIVDAPATNYTKDNVLASGVELAAINTTTDFYKHHAFITKDKNGNDLASGTAYKLTYVIIDAKGNASAFRTLNVTTNDVLAPTYTVKYKKGAAESPSDAVVKDALIEVKFNENVLDKNGVAFTPTTFDDAFVLKTTNQATNFTLVEGTHFTINIVDAKTYQIIGTPQDAGKPGANWISKGAYEFKLKDNEVVDEAKIAGPVFGTVNKITGASAYAFTVKDYEGPIAVFSPKNGDIDIDNNGDITITFSEIPYFNNAPLTDADADALIALRKGDGVGASTASPLVPRTVKVNGKVVTITPTNKPLDSEIWYRVSVTTTDIKDDKGFVFNKYDNGVGPIVSFQEFALFKTKDNRSPLISFTTMQGAVDKGLNNVPSDVTIKITLDESVRMVAGNTPILGTDLNRIRPLISLKKADGTNVEFDIIVSTVGASTVIELDPINYNPNPYLFDKLASYTVSVTGLEDTKDNAVSGSATFTIEDNTALTYTVNPANAATAIAKSGNIILSFNSPVTKTAVAGSFITLVNNTTAATDFSIDITAAGVAANGSSSVVVSYSGLSANTTYTLNIPNNVFTATSNGKVNGTSSTTFTTVDEQGPAIDFGSALAVTPDESVVPGTLKINGGMLTMTFDEDVLPGTGIILIRKPEAGAATTVAAINVQSEYVKVNSSNKKKIEITIPVTLAYSQNYFVEMPQTAFKDAAGNSFRWADNDNGKAAFTVSDVTAPSPFPTPYVLGSATWDFVTVSDATPTYTLASLLPKQDANSVPLDTDLKIVFSEPVRLNPHQLAPNELRRLTIYDQSTSTAHDVVYLADVITTEDWNADRTELTISASNFKPLLANTDYFINIDNKAFVDDTYSTVANVANTTAVLTSQYTAPAQGWYFTTRDQTAPKIDKVVTTSGAPLTAVKLNDKFVVTFTESVSLSVGFTWNNAFSLAGGYSATMASDNKTVTITPSAPLTSLAPMTLGLNNGAVKDAVGNVNIASTTNFVVEDKTAPSPISVVAVTAYAKDKVKFTVNANEKCTVWYKISSTALTTVAQVKDGGSTFAFDPTAAPAGAKTIEISEREEFKSYNVYVVFEDLFGNATAVQTVTLKTKDVTNPILGEKYPANNAVDVIYGNPTSANPLLKIKLPFSEAIQFKPGSPAKIYIRDYATNVSKHEVTQAGMVIGSSSTTVAKSDVLEVTVPSGILADKTKYYIELDYGLLMDKNNETLPGLTTADNLDFTGAFIGKDVWTFTTADETKPVLVAIAPAPAAQPLYPVHDAAYANGIVPVDASNSFVMNFTEEVQLGTGFIYIYRIGDATPQEVINVTGGNVIVDGKKVTIKRYNKLQSETEYYVVVEATAIKDIAPKANGFVGIAAPVVTTKPVVAAGPNNWTFKTKDITSPVVVVSPANSSTGIDPATVNAAATAPKFSFKDPMKGNVAEQIYEKTGATYTAVANAATKNAWFSVKANGVAVSILSATYDNATHSFAIAIAAPGFKSDTKYEITLLADKAFDKDGNAVAETTLTFTTKISTSPQVDFALVKGGEQTADILNNTALVDIDRSTYVLVKFDRSILKHGGIDQNVQLTEADLTPTFPGGVYTPSKYITFKQGASNVNYTVEVVEAGKIYKLKPTSNLSSTLNYEVEWTGLPALPNGGTGTLVKDNLYFPNGNVLDLVLADRQVKFTVADYDKPALIAGPTKFVPADNGTPATLTAPIEMVFTENILVTDGAYIQIRYANGQIFQHIPLTASMIPAATKNKLVIPHNAFAPNTGYYVVVPPDVITDASANKNTYGGFIDDTTWNFSTDDGKEPRIKTIEASTALMVEPAQNASDVPVYQILKITFDENIQVTGKNLVIYHNSGAKDDGFTDGNVWEIIPLNDATRVKISGSSIGNNLTSDVLSIYPNRQFIKEAEGSIGRYYVRIDAGAVTDKSLAANPFAGINDNTTWAFTTSNNTRAKMTIVSPVNGSTVAVEPELKMSFDMKVLAGEGSIKVYQYSYKVVDNAVLPDNEKLIYDIKATNSEFVKFVDDTNVTVKLPGKLRDNINNYYVLVDATAFTNTASSKDPISNPVNSPFTWTFKTEPDVVAPKLADLLVDAVAPIDLDCLDKGAITLTMNFDEPVMLGSGKVRILKFEGDVEAEAIGVADIAKVTFLNGNKTIAIKTASLKDNTKYYVKIDNDAIKDRSTASVGDVPVLNVPSNGNFFNGASIAKHDWSFETGDYSAPVLTVVNPIDVNAKANPVLTINVDETVVPGTGKIAVTKDGETKPVFETVVDADMITDMKIEVPVTARLLDNTLYHVTYAASLVVDVKECGSVLGNIAQLDPWSFTTGDNTAPVVTGTPAGSIAAVNTFDVTFKFSEPVTGVSATTIVVENGTIVDGSFVDNGDDSYTVTLNGVDGANMVVSFANDIVDGNNNTVDADNKFTYIIGDNKAPEALSLSPKGEYLDYKLLALEITFDDAVSKGVGSVKVYDAQNDSLIETIDAQNFTASAGNTVYTSKMSKVKFGSFYVLVDAGAFVDNDPSTVASAKEFAGISDKATWKFSVNDGEFDPCFKIISPVDNDRSVAAADLKLEFEFCGEQIIKLGKTPVIYIGDPNVITDAKKMVTITADMIVGTKVIVPISDLGLLEKVLYTVTIPDNAFIDENNNSFVGVLHPEQWNFALKDATNPTVSAVAATVYNEAGDGLVTTATITANELGNVYLVEQGVAANLAQITAAIAAKKAVAGVVYAANIPVVVSTIGLVEGTYQAIAIDAAGNVSAPSTQKVTVIKKPVIIEYDSKTIAQIQGTGATSPLIDGTYIVGGIVTGINADKSGFFMQDANKAWSGIYVADAALAAQVGIGTGIKVTGKVAEVSGVTSITGVIKSELVAPATITTDIIEGIVVDADKVAAEQYESVLVVLKDESDGLASAVSANKDWTLTTNSNAVVTIASQLFAYTPEAGKRYAVTGIVINTSNTFKVAPRNNGDVSKVNSTPELSSTISIYPTLFENVINIKSTSEVELTKAEIVNMAGQIVKQVANPGSSITTSEINRGIYVIRLHTVDGIVKTERISKR